MEIKYLDGVRLGGASLSVVLAKPPQKVVAGSDVRVNNFRVIPKKVVGLSSLSDQRRESVSSPFLSSWRDVVVGKTKGSRLVSFAEDAKMMVSGRSFKVSRRGYVSRNFSLR